MRLNRLMLFVKDIGCAFGWHPGEPRVIGGVTKNGKHRLIFECRRCGTTWSRKA